MSFPRTRLRRMRKDQFSRQLMQETVLLPKHLIYPVFLMPGEGSIKEAIATLPGVFRHTLDSLLQEAAEVCALGIPAIALFPVIPATQKSLSAIESYNAQGLVPCAIAALKAAYPILGVITDIALDPYTTHGQDGLLDAHGQVCNDKTLEVLVLQALCHARAGADMVAPSDMMDGRIGRIRDAFETAGLIHTRILAYSAKYASTLYGPFRDAVGSTACLGAADKKTYQMDPANVQEALREVAQDLEEGADAVMVKPGLPYLDVLYRVKSTFQAPTFAYQVSGEYAMLHLAAAQGIFNIDAAMYEAVLSMRRAGADAVFTYHAKALAAYIQR